MYCTRAVSDAVTWVGGNDRRLSLFENLFPIPRGVTYNSYLRFPELKVVGNAKTFTLMRQFYDFDLEGRIITVVENDTLSLGAHTLRFVFTPMVHWPEVMMTYEEHEHILFPPTPSAASAH